MAEEIIILDGKDCSIINNQSGHAEAIRYFISQRSKLNVFNFLPDKERDDNDIAYFNTKDAYWYAGRLVGEANFVYENRNYKILIKPRFGPIQLFRMIEEIYNIRLTDSKSSIENNLNYQVLIKKLIAFMWANMLAKANKHGIPRDSITRTYKGTTIKGRLHVRKSAVPYYTEKQIISQYREKQADQTVVRILNRAYDILNLEYGLGQVKQPAAARNAIEQLKASIVSDKYVTEQEYHSLNLKSIYNSYKPVIDLSWDIIKNREFGNKDSKKDGQSFFIDMAELWEIYLTTIIRRQVITKGWSVTSPKSQIYKNKDFSRSIIPDIVLEKNNKSIIFDAKYKRMAFRYYDYDRSDFFQIHTYTQYYEQDSDVIAGGLLYPFSEKFNNERIASNESSSLYGSDKSTTKFIIDGIDFSEVEEDTIKKEENNFLKRIESLINGQ